MRLGFMHRGQARKQPHWVLCRRRNTPGLMCNGLIIMRFMGIRRKLNLALKRPKSDATLCERKGPHWHPLSQLDEIFLMDCYMWRFTRFFWAAFIGIALMTAPIGFGPVWAQVNGGVFALTDLVVEVLEDGDGAEVGVGQELQVEFTSWIVEDGGQGRVFDSSAERGGTWDFVLGAHPAIKGWDQGLHGLKVGTKVRLTIPPDMAYGDRGFNGPVAFVPPGSWVISEIVLVAAN